MRGSQGAGWIQSQQITTWYFLDSSHVQYVVHWSVFKLFSIVTGDYSCKKSTGISYKYKSISLKIYDKHRDFGWKVSEYNWSWWDVLLPYPAVMSNEWSETIQWKMLTQNRSIQVIEMTGSACCKALWLVAACKAVKSDINNQTVDHFIRNSVCLHALMNSILIRQDH